MHRVPGEIVRSVRFRSNGQHPVTYGVSLVVAVDDEPGATRTVQGESVAELRSLARSLGLKPVVTWSNSRVVLHHVARTQGEAMTKTDTTTTLTVEAIAAMNAVERVQVAKQEAALVKEAKRRGDSEMPSTPVLDYMNGTEYRQMQQNKSTGKRSGTGGNGKAVNFDDAALKTIAEEMLAAGHTTKAAMLKAMRAKGKGARQQRFYPIADKVIEAAKANGTFPEKAVAAKKAAATLGKKRAANNAAATKKAAATKTAAKKAPAKKAAAKKASTTKKAAPAKAAAAKKVVTNFKKTTAAKTTAAKRVTVRK